MTSNCNLNQNHLINSLLTELNNKKNNLNNNKNNINLIFKLRKFIKQLFDSGLHENDLILNELEIILNRLQPIDLTSTNDEDNFDDKNIDDDSSALYFEYSFFKLLKFILSFSFNGNDLNIEYRSKNESNLIELMKYCLNKSISQYELMQQNKKYYLIKQKLDCDDRHDQLNLIELSRNFRINLLNVMHRFKESYIILKKNQLDANPNISKKNKSSISYYDCMSSLLSIYVDISLDLKSCLNQIIKRSSKKKALELLNFKLKCLTTNLCLNIFYLLDSCVYYVCNVILQLSNVNHTNLRYIVPLLKKLINVRQINLNQRSNKMCRSLYLRMILIYSRLIYMSSYNRICIRQLEFFKKFLYSIEINSNFKSYIINLLNKYTSDVNIRTKSQTFNQIDLIVNDNNKRLRKYLLYDLKQEQINLFLEAFHNKTIKNNSSLKRNFKIDSVNCLKLCDNHNLTIKVEENIETDQIEQINNSNEEDDISRENLFNIVESFKNKICIEDSFELIDSDMIEYDIIINKLPTQKEIPKKPKFKNLHLVLDRIDLSKYREIAPYRYLIEEDKTIIREIDYQKSEINLQNSQERGRRLSLSARKYMEINSRRPSPNRNNISKLNLFRNIFDDDDQIHKTNEFEIENNFFNKKLEIDDTFLSSAYNSENSNLSTCKTFNGESSVCDSGYYSASSKFYKLNDLVSVMVNEDYFKAEACDKNKFNISDFITSTPDCNKTRLADVI